MTDMISSICHGRAFDEMDSSDDDMIVSYSFEDFLCPAKVVPDCGNDATARCISVDSDGSSSASNISIVAPNKTAPQHASSEDIFDEYDVLPTVLGTGNYGTVRECLHRASGKKYAVKTIDKSKVSRMDHIRREVELLRTVDHPGIMKMVDCFEDEEYVHIVTEMCTGGELFDKIIDNTHDYGCLPEDQAMRIVKSLLEAVEYLHDRDIVHRDIKPENVLFESSEEGSSIRLIDFGLSRRHSKDDVCMSNQVGTPYYMSPGVLRGKYDRSCDLWSVGVVSYILLTGYPPFNGGSDPEIHDAVMRGQLVFERDVWRNLSAESRDFVSRLLRTDSSRIGSARDALRHPWMS